MSIRKRQTGNMRCLYITIICLVCSAFMPGRLAADDFELTMTDTELRDHFAKMESIVDHRYTSQIRSYIYTYIKTNRDKTQGLLDRSQLYFPTIEKYLAESGLPEDLKYLTIIESALDPHARSWVGAVGLWQFMPVTGKENGLRITKSIDERRDPHKSTEAAMKYLGWLYKKYGDWALALSAYNAGPGRVNTAIRRSGSRDFWKLRPYLPRETRGYVPAYIAAAYVFKHVEKFGFAPNQPHADLFFTQPIEVFKYLTFDEIARVTDLDKQVIRTLNPAYRYSYIPYSRYGYVLTLPSRVIPLMEDHLVESGAMERVELTINNPFEDDLAGDLPIHFALSEYIPLESQSIFELAEMFRVDPYQIKHWNGIKTNTIPAGTTLHIPVFKRGGNLLLAHYQRKAAVDYVSGKAVNLLVYDSSENGFDLQSPELVQSPDSRLPWTVLQRGESYADVMRQRRKASSELEQKLASFAGDRDNFPLTYGCRIPVSAH